jgi:hypothetical protein
MTTHGAKIVEALTVVVVHVDGVRLCLWTAATNGPIVHPPGNTYEYGEPRWNDIDRGKPKNSEKNLSQCHFVHHKFQGVNSSLRGNKPVTNRLSYDWMLQLL